MQDKALPPISGRWRWALAMLPLTALFLAAQAPDRRWRGRWSASAFVLALGLVAFYVYALFLPLIQLSERL